MAQEHIRNAYPHPLTIAEQIAHGQRGAAMTEQREIGFPWFDRHALRGGKEIFAFTRDMVGERCDAIRGCEWRDREALLTYYASPSPYEMFCDGYIGLREFATWEEAEAWLTAPTESAVSA